MFDILGAIVNILSGLNTSTGFVGSLTTIFDHFKNQSHIEETLATIRKKSKTAYESYCNYRMHRQSDLGIPLEEHILGYWESCLHRSTLPSVDDMVSSGTASELEAEVILPYLLEQWMTVPEFSAWLHDILIQSNVEEITESLAYLPKVLESVSQLETSLTLQGICNLATVIKPACINDAKYSCDDLDIKHFFTVDNNFHTMFRVISAEEDVPQQEAVETVMALIQNGSPVIIAGNGGQGKTSLMMRAAIQWAFSGHLVVWVSLSYKDIITEQKAEVFFSDLNKLIPAGQRVLLCIDNPFEGRISFSSLQKRWHHNAKMQLIMAERENRLTLLVDPGQDLLLHWFDDANLVVLQGVNQTRSTYQLKDYTLYSFPEKLERRKTILEKCASFLVKDGVVKETDKSSVVRIVLNKYEKPYVSLVELIYRTLFELKKVAAKPESIKMDWEEWGDFINREFKDVDSDLQLYGVIAAFKVFNTPLSLSLFCKYFDLNERKLKNRLSERFVPRHIEPVIYQEGSKTIQPKHDVIAELFFLFAKGKVTINDLILDMIDVMDENEMEMLLANMINKKEIQKGRKYYIGEIDYWSYMEKIYSQTKNGPYKLTESGRAYMGLGFLWSRHQRKPSESNKKLQTVLDDIAPVIDNNILMLKFYTEWGIWAGTVSEPTFAEEKFRTVIRTDPNDVPARTELGRLLAKQKGREKEAETLLREVIKIEPKHLQSRTELGRLLAKQKGREKEAETFFLQIIEIDPKNIQSRTELGRLLAKQKGREKEAETFLREAIRIDPKNLHPHTELGRLLAKQKGREKEAETFLLRIIQIAPKDIQSRTELGRLLAKQKGREKEAETFLQEAIRFDPKNLHPRTVLAGLYEKLDRIPEAKRLYQELCEIDPGNRFGEEGLARLK